jgi:hypothetical protein
MVSRIRDGGGGWAPGTIGVPTTKAHKKALAKAINNSRKRS